MVKPALTPKQRLALLERVFKQGTPVAQVCRDFGISRYTFYKWKRRWEKAGRQIDALRDRKPQFDRRHLRVKPDLEREILTIVIDAPNLSKYGIARKISEKLGPVVSPHGVYNVLVRNGLNRPEARFAYSSAHAPEVPTPVTWSDRVRYVLEQFIPSLAPAPPPAIARLLQALRAGPPGLSIALNFLKTFSLSTILSSATLYSFLWWINYITSQVAQVSVGLIFASIALFMGSVFFLYSLKYYITLAIVLSFSQQGTDSKSSIVNHKSNGKRGSLNWLLGFANGNGPSKEERKTGPIGLEPSLEHITLKRYPKISVHIPLYNEKNVVERLIAATTNFDYKGDYEVILADDSTDETTRIIRDYMKSVNGKRTTVNGEGWTLTQVEVRPGVTLKHLHRTSRSGFKGGALADALKHTDKRAEFVVVFDADFVPYPDTLELFLKYFQATAGTLSFARVHSHIAAVQGYQWHVLNKSENWITRGVRSEYAGSYVIERSGEEIYSGLKQISGAVYMIRRDVLEELGWETSITEDFQLTLKLYEKGYKVVYTPYIQAPAECVSTLKRLIRQRMRWAEGHSNNIRKMFVRLLFGHWEEVGGPKPLGMRMVTNVNSHSISMSKVFIPSPLTLSEKLEFLYISPYYLQAFFFLVGTISWLISETVFQAGLPFWTSLWGWSLVFTNLLSLPLMNAVGLFLEESEERDYQGIASFLALSYILVPFQAYAALKGFIQKEEGPWFRTPKTGHITDVFARGRFYRFISGILPGRRAPTVAQSKLPASHQLQGSYLSLASANNTFNTFSIKTRKGQRWIGKLMVTFLLVISTTLITFAPYIPVDTNPDIPTPGAGTILSPEGKKSYIPNLNLVREAHAATSSKVKLDTSFTLETKGLKLSGDIKDFTDVQKPEFTVKLKRNIFSKIGSWLTTPIGKEPELPEVKVTVIDHYGRKVKGVKVDKNGGDSVEVVIDSLEGLDPGKYSIIVQDKDGNGLIQDFTWGVLAINTSKSIYLPNETAKLSMAVLDEKGSMVCDASLQLQIRNPKSEVRNLTREDGSIKVNPGCRKWEMILEPDYEAEYQVGEPGEYEMVLTAETSEGTYTIKDSFEVRESVPFDIERYTATRIWPHATYPVIFTVKANKDYRGIVEESIPDSFETYELAEEEISEFLELKPNTGLSEPLEVNTDRGKKVLRWFVNWEKGKTYQFGYKYDAPNISPAFHLLGPLWVGDFKEARKWQIAVDAVTFVAYTRNSVTSGTSMSLTKPSGLADDDYLLVLASKDDNPLFSEPLISGFTTIYRYADTGGDDMAIAGAYKKITSAVGEPGSYSLSWSDSEAAVASLIIVRGADLTTFIDVAAVQTNHDNTNAPDASSVTTATDNAIVIVHGGSRNDSDVDLVTNPTNYSLGPGGNASITDGWDRSGVAVGDAKYITANRTIASFGLEDPGAFGGLSGSRDWILSTFAIRPVPISITGTAYTDDNETTALTPVSVCVAVDSDATTYCDTTDGSGVFTITGVPAAGGGEQLTLFVDGGSTFGNTVTVGDGNDILSTDNLRVYQNHVLVRYEQGTNISIVDMDAYDSDQNNDDMLYDAEDAATDTLDVESGYELFVYDSYTFDPDGDVDTAGSAGNLQVDDNATATLDTVEAGDSTNSIGGDLLIEGGATLNIDADTDVSGGDITTSGTSPTVDTTAGTPTVTMAATGTIGGGTTPSITFHDMAINTGATTTFSDTVTFEGGDLTTTTTGSIAYSGTPTVTIEGTGTLGGGTGSITFYNLSLGDDAASATTTLQTNNIVIYIALTVNTNHTFAMGTNSLTIGNTTISGSGDITVDSGASTSQSASGTVTIKSVTSDATWTGPGTFTAYNLTIGDGIATIGVDNETGDLALNVDNDFTITNASTFKASSTANFQVGNNWSNSGTFDMNTSTVTMDAQDSGNTLSGNMTASSRFYNLTFDDGGTSGAWTFNADAVVHLDFTITGGSVTAPSGSLFFGRNFDNDDTFIHNSGTVNMNGSGSTTKTITSTSALNFYSLTDTLGSMIYFEASKTFTIAAGANLTLNGLSCTGLTVVRSTIDGTQFTLTDNTGGTTSVDYADIQDSNATNAITATNSVDSDNNSNWTIAANSCIGASQDASDTATGYSFQRKTFWDSANSRYWLFYHDGTHIEIRYSSNGSTWNVDDDILAYDTNDFSVWWDQIGTTEYVWLAVTTANDILVRRGTLTTTNVTWDTEANVLAFTGGGASDDYSYPYISLDSSNYMWVGARYYNGTNYVYKAVRSDDSDTGDATWSGVGFGTTITEAQLSDDQTNTNVFGNIVPLASQDMYATFVVNTALEGCLWDHTPDARWEDSGDTACSPTSGGGSDEPRTSTGPIKIDDASNFGVMTPGGRQIVQTSGGTLYAILNDGGSCEVWMSADGGATWTEQDSASNPACSSGSDIAAVIDGNDDIHIIYEDDGAGDIIKYITFDTPTNSFVTEETVTGMDTPTDMAIAVDSSNIPHVAASTTITNPAVEYSNRVGASWDSPNPVSIQETFAATFISVDIAINEDDIPEVVYIEALPSDLTGAEGNLNDATSFTNWDIDSVVNNTSGQRGASIAIDQAGNTWVGYVDASVDYATLAKHDDGTAWDNGANWATQNNTNVGYEPSIAVITSDIYIFYEEDNDDIAYDRYDDGGGTWKGETVLETGTYQDVHARWSEYNNNDGYFIDYLFSDVTDIYWNYLDARPVNIDDPSDFDDPRRSVRSVVRDTSGVLYAILDGFAVVEVWKSTDGVAWSEQDSSNKPTSNEVAVADISVSIDSSDIIHIIYHDYITGGAGSIMYETFDTSAGTFGGTPETVDSHATQIFQLWGITVDSNNIPHIFYSEGLVGEVYENRVGGSWSQVILENVGASGTNGITINDEDIPEVSYINSTDNDLTAAVGDDNDPTTFTLQDVDTDVNDTDNQRGSSIAVDHDGNTWVAYVDSDSDIALAKHNDADAWSIWTTETTKTENGYEPSIAIDGRDIYVFYEEDSTDQKIVYDIYDSDAAVPAWGGETVLHTPPSGGDYQDVKAKWAFEWNNYGPNRIDFLFSDGTDVYWSYLHLRRMPTNVDNASDFGALTGAGRQVVRTSSGTLYSFIIDTGFCEVWKSTDEGNSWSQQDSGDSPVCTDELAMTIDSTDALHLVYGNATGDVVWRTFSTSTDQFGTVDGVHNGGISDVTRAVSVALDSNDAPHVVFYLFDDPGTDYIYYRNRTSGSWQTLRTLESGGGGSFDMPDITINEDNIPEISYVNRTDDDLTAAVGDANNAASFTLQDVDTLINDVDNQRGTSIGIDSSGNTWIAYVDENGTDDYIALAYHPDASGWTADWEIKQTGNIGNEPSIVIDGTDIYTFYEDDQDDIVYDKYDGTTALGAAVKIDDSGDPGAMAGVGRQIVRTSDGTLYSVINDGGTIEVWSSSNGASWSQQDSDDAPNADQDTSPIIAAAIDSIDNIHIVWEENDGTNYKINYVSFDTSANNYGTEETARTTTDQIGEPSLSVDSSNIPHIVYRKVSGLAGGRYTNRVGGTWKAPVSVTTEAITLPLDIVINEDDIPEAAYIYVPDSDLTAVRGNQNDATSFPDSQDVDAQVNTTSGTAGASIGIDSEGNTLIAYIDNGTNDYVAIGKHNDTDAWTTWSTSTTTDLGFEPTLAVYKNLVYIFYEEDSTDQKIVYQIYNGANFSGETDLASTASTDYQDAKVKWSYFYDNKRQIQLDFLYSDNTDVYYNKLELGFDGEKVLEMHASLQDVKARWSFLNNPSYTTYGIDYLYSDSTDVFYNRLKFGSTPGSQDAIDTVSSGTAYNLSAVSDDVSPFDVHLIYIDDSSPKALIYARWDNGSGVNGTWQTAITLDSAGGDDTYATLSLDTNANDLYALWIDDTDKDINYRQCDVTSATDECDAIGKWLSTQDGWKTGTLASITSNYAADTRIFAEWTVGSASPYHVQFDTIIIPENVWLFFGFAPFLPLLLKRLRRKKHLALSKEYQKTKNTLNKPMVYHIRNP